MNDTNKFYSAEEIQKIARRALSDWIRDLGDDIVQGFFREIVEEIADGVYQPFPDGVDGIEGRTFERFMMVWIVTNESGMGVVPYGQTLMQTWRMGQTNVNGHN